MYGVRASTAFASYLAYLAWSQSQCLTQRRQSKLSTGLSSGLCTDSNRGLRVPRQVLRSFYCRCVVQGRTQRPGDSRTRKKKKKKKYTRGSGRNGGGPLYLRMGRFFFSLFRALICEAGTHTRVQFPNKPRYPLIRRRAKESHTSEFDQTRPNS